VSTKKKSNASSRAREPRLSFAEFRRALARVAGRQTNDVWGIVLVVLAVLLGLAFLGQAGPVGRVLSTGLVFLFGVWAYALPVGLAAVGMVLALGRRGDAPARLAVGAGTAFVASLALFHLLTGTVSLAGSVELVRERGGAVGSLIAFPLRRLLGLWGAFVVLASGVAAGVLVATRTSVRELVSAIGDLWKGLEELAAGVTIPRSRAEKRGRHAAPRVVATPAVRKPPRRSRPAPSRPEPEPPPAEPIREPQPVISTPKPNTGYQLPPLDLLAQGGGKDVNRRLLEETAQALEETLHQHGVDASITKIVPGPTVTRFEVELAPGVKVNRVSNLAHDIAYALATPDVRLLVPIPGRSAIGIEVPNRQRRLVALGDILRSPVAQADPHPLSVGLGMDISGTPCMLNLTELPHVLIAGATGAGKSSCINSIVTSILMRATPDDVRLLLVDPKRVELGQYNGVPHLLTRVITNPKKANDALKWAVAEMDRRYDLLADAKVRDIVGYREKYDAGRLDPESFDRFPYVVVIVDELNDLMMVAGREVEESIVRIAQMARAVGIHLVIATQRPSVDVITGVIKANIPSRLAFSVASQTDSRVIIDAAGAEKLVGMGDMLMVTAKEPRPQRIQGAWVSEEEIHAVVEWVKAQQEARYREKEVLEAAAQAAAARADEEDDEEEALVRQAMELVVRSQLGSTSMLQRKLRIGFARAGRVMDILERRGVVGPSQGSKAREVLMTEEELEELLARDSVDA
jgi:S-DNA-T family DNA segregation ATPase FtsK/SpoIIIE